jgi:hypothetical protein
MIAISTAIPSYPYIDHLPIPRTRYGGTWLLLIWVAWPHLGCLWSSVSGSSDVSPLEHILGYGMSKEAPVIKRSVLIVSILRLTRNWPTTAWGFSYVCDMGRQEISEGHVAELVEIGSGGGPTQESRLNLEDLNRLQHLDMYGPQDWQCCCTWAHLVHSQTFKWPPVNPNPNGALRQSPTLLIV